MGRAAYSSPMAQPAASNLNELQSLLAELEYRRKTNRIDLYFPETGKLRRELYAKHMEAFNHGIAHTIRVAIAGNRTGKSEGLGSYETTKHLTGEYCDWWNGHRFDRPIKVLVAGDTKETTRDILQYKLLGKPGELGTGMIPKRCIGVPRMRTNGGGAIDFIPVMHKSGLWSYLYFKSYEQGRKIFQGQEFDFIWLDEECPEDVYGEAVTRLMTTKGRGLLTFTPLNGVTPLIRSLREMTKRGDAAGESNVPATINITWDDVPHLSDEDKAMMLANTPPHTHKARMLGIPMMGEGAVYPIDPTEITCKPFDIPKHWPRVYAMDVGWNRTAALFGAYDEASDTIYCYSEHYRGQAEPEIHAQAVKARGGDWMNGVIDKASRSASQINGADLLSLYRGLGLRLYPTDATGTEHTVEAGIMAVLSRLSTGRLKIFSTLQNTISEYGGYHRKDGKIVKEDDHLMDCLRYLVVWGMTKMKVYAPTTIQQPASQTFGLYA